MARISGYMVKHIPPSAVVVVFLAGHNCACNMSVIILNSKNFGFSGDLSRASTVLVELSGVGKVSWAEWLLVPTSSIAFGRVSGGLLILSDGLARILWREDGRVML